MPADLPEAMRLVATGRGFMSSFLGDADVRTRLFDGNIVRDRVIVATQNGRVVGYATFKLDGKGPYQPCLADFRRVYGRKPSVWKYLLFRLLERRKNSSGLYLCGLKVMYRARRQGIGQQLLSEFEQQAVRLQKKYVNLEVFSENHRAQQLYTQRGYATKKEISFPLLSRIFPFSRVIHMRKKV